MSQLNTLLESAGQGWKNLQSDAARLASKWEKTGLLEGLGNETNKNNMSLMLENQAKQLVVEASSTGGSANFTGQAGTGDQWAGIALPLVRKVFGQIAAKEFVSVQPMNLPSGLVFYLDFQYGSNKDPFAQNGSLYGTNGTDFPFATPAAEGGLYGAGRYSYSINTHKTASAATTVSTASFVDVNYDSSLSASVAGDTIKKVAVPVGNLGNYDSEAVRSFVIESGSTVTTAKVLPQFTSVSGTDIIFLVTASASEMVQSSVVNVYYSLATQDNTRGDFEAGNSDASTNDWDPGATDISIPEVNIQMRSEALVAKTRKLKAVWTPEFAQDLNAYQSLDAEAEVTNVMSEYISLEIDLEILDMIMKDAAAGTEYWSAVNNRTITGGSEVFGDAAFYNTQGQWFQTLGTKINKLSNKIHQLTLRGGANFMVVSPTVATILESIPGFAADNAEADKMKYAFGVQKAGQLSSRYQVYKNPYMTENTILMGFRGSQFLEAGAVFAPYIPLIMTPLVYDPDTFTPRKGLLTRYAKKMLRPEFYGKVVINGLNTL
jgi:hypothetical protein